jgi:hypothetical protein
MATATASLAACLLAAPARAEGVSDLLSLEVHGFGSQGFLLTTGNEYLVTGSKRGSFQLSEVAINLTKELTDRLRFGVQIFAQNFGMAGSYTPQIDWFGLDYRFRDWLGLRAGRLKIPFGLYNEVNDIDAARVPVLLPQSVYPQQARGFLFAQTGAELYGFLRSPAAGALEYRLYAGTVYIDPKLVIPVGSTVQLKFNAPYVVGGRLFWETPLSGLRLGVSYVKLRLDTVAYAAGMSIGIANDSSAAIGSLEYTHRALSVTAEYTRGHTKQDSILPTSKFEFDSDAVYVMAAFAATDWLQPCVYYSLDYPDASKRKGLDHKQRDLAFTLRFDVNAHWLVKLEGHYMAGTSGLVNPLSITPPPADPARHWGVFLAKTTAYF